MAKRIRMFNNYPLSYLKAYVKASHRYWPSYTRQQKVIHLRCLTVFPTRSLSSAFRQSWGLPPR